MADDNAVELIKRGDARFAARASLDALRQEIALNFAPQHASWTETLDLGRDFAAHLVDGTPLIVARDFCDMIGATLRPPGRQWFWHRTPYSDINERPENRDYLDWRSQQLMRFMTERSTGFGGAMDEADDFYGLFGDAVLAVDYATPKRRSLSVQHYHSKDAAWEIGSDNEPDTITRKEMLLPRVIKARFSSSIDKPLHHSIDDAAEKAPMQPLEVRHEVMPAEEYDAYVKRSGGAKRPGRWVSVWIDVRNAQILRETFPENFRYVIPRAGRRYGHAYGISRATMIALPDARLIQAQAAVLLEAAEKQVDPPIIAYGDVIRGSPDLRSRSINFVDAAYDERKGQPIYPLELAKNFRLGIEEMMRTEGRIGRAFSLDRMRYPDTRNTKTVEEAAFLIDEYVRSVVPMFEPMKSEYSDAVLYVADALVEAANGYVGREMPPDLKGLSREEMLFSWENAISDMLERQKVQRISQVAQVGQTIAGYEAAAQQVPALQQVDSETMMRDGVVAVGGSGWIMAKRKLEAKREAIAASNAQAQMVAAAPNIAQLVDSGVNAAEAASNIPMIAGQDIGLMPEPV